MAERQYSLQAPHLFPATQVSIARIYYDGKQRQYHRLNNAHLEASSSLRLDAPQPVQFQI